MAAPAWVAALPSDEDEDDVQPRQFQVVGPNAVAQAEVYVVEDDDVKVLNVMKHDHPTFSLGRDELHHLESSKRSIRQIRKFETRQQERMGAVNFESQREHNIDGELFNNIVVRPQTGEGILGGGPASQLRKQGFPTGAWTEQGAWRRRPAANFFGSESILTAQARRNGSIAGPEPIAVAGAQPRERGVMRGGFAPPFREQRVDAGVFGLPVREQGSISLSRDQGFQGIGLVATPASERMTTFQAHNSGPCVFQEQQSSFGAAGLRVQEFMGRLPLSAPSSLETALTGNTMTEWQRGFRANIGTGLSHLHWNIVSFCRAYELTPEQVQVRREAFEYVRHMVHGIWEGAEAHLFGSTVTGLALPWSDIDVVVISNRIHGSGQKSWLPILGKHMLGHGKCKSIKSILHAKVPLLKVVFKSGLACDISLDAHNGPRGVPVIRQFMQQYEALRPLCLVLKFFLGQQNLNEPYTGGLGSFCLINMVVSHLQKLRVSGAGHDLGALLLSFFSHYSSVHNYETDVVSTRADCCSTKLAKGWVNISNPDLLAVEDPLDPTSNIAKGSYKIQEIRTAFRKAEKMLLAHWQQQNVLMELVDMTGDPEQRPKPHMLMSATSKQFKQKKRKRFDSDGCEVEDAHPVRVQRKGRIRLKQQGSDLVIRGSKKSKSKLKKKKENRAARQYHGLGDLNVSSRQK